jgi:hypothetical protein
MKSGMQLHEHRSPLSWLHGLHLFCVVSSAVIARNVANQMVLDAQAPAGPEALGRLYVAVAIIAGGSVAVLGWLARHKSPRRVATGIHLLASSAIIGSVFFSAQDPYVAIAVYLLMDVSFALMLLVFGLMLGASMGPREARRHAAGIGAGGIVGGLVGGAMLTGGASFNYSSWLLLVAGLLAVVPIGLLARMGASGPTFKIYDSPRERDDYSEMPRYGRWVALSTFLMVATTTLVDYEFRCLAKMWFESNELIAFFGFVVILGGCATIVFQLTLLERILERWGLFATAMTMPASLIVVSALFGIMPAVWTMVLLKLVDSGANMSVQQATSGLLLAPLGRKARSVWQGRIDGLAKRGGQLTVGVWLAYNPGSPTEVLPFSLVLCSLWLGSLFVTRKRYIAFLSSMLKTRRPDEMNFEIQDHAVIRWLEHELDHADVTRGLMILALLERAQVSASGKRLMHWLKQNPRREAAIGIVLHFNHFEDMEALSVLSGHEDVVVGEEALSKLCDFSPERGESRARHLLFHERCQGSVKNLCIGILAGKDARVLSLSHAIVEGGHLEAQKAWVRGLEAQKSPFHPTINAYVRHLCAGKHSQISRRALILLGRHPDERTCDTLIAALRVIPTRAVAKHSLARCGPLALPYLEKALADFRKDPQAVECIVWVIGRVRVPEAFSLLLHALQDPHVSTRQQAAMGLKLLGQQGLDSETFDWVALVYLPEISFYKQMRWASECRMPDSAAGAVLQHTLRQRAQASLDTLFRLFALNYPEGPIGVAYAAITSQNKGESQLALELLDTLLEPRVRQYLGEAITSRPKLGNSRSQQAYLEALVVGSDRFLAELTLTALHDMDGAVGGDYHALSTQESLVMQRSEVDQILELQSIPIFRGASAEDLLQLAGWLTLRKADKGTVLFREGGEGEALFILREGSVSISRDGQEIERMVPGDAFGLLAVLDRLPRESSATTQSQTSVWVLKAEDLHQLLAEHPMLMHSMFRVLTVALRQGLEAVALGKR